MPQTIGIPRALLFHEYGDFWQAFLESLGANVIVSDHTNPSTMESGTRLCVDEACLPVKVLCGHVENLSDRVDWVFLPRIVSVSPREYTCPKMLGLPEMLTQQMEAHRAKVLSATVDLYHSHLDLIEPCVKIARQLGGNRVQAYRAIIRALEAHKKALLARRSEQRIPTGAGCPRQVRIGVLGHRYLVSDEALNMGLARHLNMLSVETVVAEDAVPLVLANKEAGTLAKPLFWSYEKRVLGSAFYLIRHRLVDGLIQLVSFGCGPDSMVASLIESRAQREHMPYLLLSIDEHSGETGALTRLEAFVDMLTWKAESV